MFKHLHSCLRSSRSCSTNVCLSAVFLLILCAQCANSRSIKALPQRLPFVQEISNQQNPIAASRALEVGRPIEREILGGQTHSYHIALSAGQFVSVSIQQRGMDVVERVFAPDGKLITESNSELRPQEADNAAFVAETGGIHRLDVEAKIKGSTGHYEIRLADIHVATEQDRLLHEADRLSMASRNSLTAGKYDEAYSIASRALEAGEKALGPDHIYIGNVLYQLGEIQWQKGDYAKAESLFQRAFGINEKALGLEHPQTVQSINGLGLVSLSMNDHAKARRLFQQALEITEKTLGADHPRVVTYLINLEVIHFNLGDLTQAERELQRALTIAEKSLEPDDRLLARALNNLGDLYRVRKDYDRAETLLQRSLAIYEKSFGPEHPIVAGTLQNLGIIARERKDYARALQIFRRALAIQEHALGPEHQNVASALNSIANIYRAQGDYPKALEMQQRVLRIAEKSAGLYGGLTLTALGNMARTYAAQGDIVKAIEFQKRADEVIETTLGLNLAIGSERQKLAYLDSLAERTDRTLSLNINLAPNDPAAGALAILVLLQRKGRVLDAMSESFTALRQRFDAKDQKILDQLSETTAQLANLALNGPKKLAPDEYQKQIKSLEEQKEQLEAEISQRSAEFRAQSQTVTLAAVQAAIPRGAALIEFATYRPFDPKAESNQTAYGEPHYVAYVVHHQGEIVSQELGSAKEFDARIAALRQALSDPERKDVRQLARSVDEKVMQPVRAVTGNATQLLISADGELNLIPFGALVDEQGRYLIERYSFTYLTSGRDLLRMQETRESKSKPLVIANPFFGEANNELLAQANASTKPIILNRRRRSVTTARDLSAVYFAPLEGTAQEARAIEALFPDARVLTGMQATKFALKEAAAPRLLHIATHGFFLQSASAAATANAPAVTRDIDTKARIENPLLRSGLALAKANLRDGNSKNDGILTALEASGLNLWGTRLVVLSACDTGVGEVRNGEGVYGLRRAFVLAGAESVVMSLWPVSDYTTRILMTSYYRNLKQGLGRGAALRQVQIDMLKRNGQLHPFYWANFIQSGDWASLDGKR
jgi:CHAT domain-containing protein/Tfp pilus assembly protein PilF